MSLKKEAEEYFRNKKTGEKPVGFITIEKFFRKHFHAVRPQFSKTGVGATKAGIKNFVRLVRMVEDMGKMGVIRDVDEVINGIENLMKEHY